MVVDKSRGRAAERKRSRYGRRKCRRKFKSKKGRAARGWSVRRCALDRAKRDPSLGVQHIGAREKFSTHERRRLGPPQRRQYPFLRLTTSRQHISHNGSRRRSQVNTRPLHPARRLPAVLRPAQNAHLRLWSDSDADLSMNTELVPDTPFRATSRRRSARSINGRAGCGHMGERARQN